MAIEYACKRRPLWALDRLLRAVADDPKWAQEIANLQAIGRRMTLAYRPRAVRSASMDWLAWWQERERIRVEITTYARDDD